VAKICYADKRFSDGSLQMLQIVNNIIEDYSARGFSLTLRQLYYQLVGHDLFPDDRRWSRVGNTSKWVRDPNGTKNADPNYKWLGVLVSDGRLAGYIDWDAITDRTRVLKKQTHWRDPGHIMGAVKNNFKMDYWEDQDYYVECFVPGTPVITRDGYKPIDKLIEGDEVLTHEGRYQKITKLIRNSYNGPIKYIKACGIQPIGITPNHPVWLNSYDNSKSGYKGSRRKFFDAKWSNAENIKQFDKLKLPKRNIEPCKLPGPLTLIGGNRSKIISNFCVDDLTLMVCGLYIAEGSIRSDQRTIQFTLNNQKEKYADLIVKWAEKLKVSYEVTTGKGTIIVYIFSKSLCGWLENEFGNGSFNKKLPRWLMNTSSKHQLKLLEYYFRGDGCFWDKTTADIAASTRSEQLAGQIQLLMLWAGYSCSLNIIEDHKLPRYNVSVAGSSAEKLANLWGITIPTRNYKYNNIIMKDDCTEFSVRATWEESYSGFVYNMEVEEDHTYCVPFVVHNCWVEKDALVEVVGMACSPLDVPYFACRGYTSQSAMWEAAMRIQDKIDKDGISPVIVHLGDHDPSGVDMSRDIEERLTMFGTPPIFRRIALNMDQINQYNPPPNPTKLTDSRSGGYLREFGEDCWELDSLDPEVIVNLITEEINKWVDSDLKAMVIAQEQEYLEVLDKISKNWETLV
jgi:hypothetical protein